MFGSGAFDFVDVLSKAADASWYRNEILSNNIANAQTPNYKRKDVAFNYYLEKAIDGTTASKDSLAKKVHEADLSQAKMVVYTDNSNLNYRLDGNNVDIATENVELATNQIVYNTLIDSMTHEFNRIKSVLTK